MRTAIHHLIQDKIADPAKWEEPEGNYAFQYQALSSWFQSGEPWTADRVMLGCLAVYGWMPRILEVGRKADQCLTPQMAEDIAKRLTNGTANIDPPFVNSSIVGTSKFLHFWKPDEFPIWDSRVKRALGLSNERDTIKLYDQYCKAMISVGNETGRSLRDIEQQLFLIGRPK